jgi:hypothetical protein
MKLKKYILNKNLVEFLILKIIKTQILSNFKINFKIIFDKNKPI